MPARNYLPFGLNAADVCLCLGIVSDTHMPDRLRALPPALFEALAGCDLLLHAGDVGELRVLDQLSAIAPVVAVHGNDDSPEAHSLLPFETVIAAGGQRVFLWHSHHPNLDEERTARRSDELLPQLERTRTRARAAGASLAVFGHWHIPLAHEAQGVTVVNPGAIASGNEITRHLRPTVALAWLCGDATEGFNWRISHVDLDHPGAPYDAGVEWEKGFAHTLARYEESILDPVLQAEAPRWIALLPPALLERRRELLRQMAHRVWAGEIPLITSAMVDAAVRSSGLFTPAEIAQHDEIARLVESAEGDQLPTQ